MIIIAQVLGVSAVALYILSFQLKKRKDIVFTICISNCFYVLQYLLLGAFSGAAIDILSTISSFLAAKKDLPKFRKFSKIAIIIMMLLMSAVGLALAIVQKDWVELLPIAGAIFQTCGLWFDNEQTIRKFAIAGAPFWIVYNIICMAYGAAVGTAFTMISAAIGLARYRKNNK